MNRMSVPLTVFVLYSAACASRQGDGASELWRVYESTLNGRNMST
jgi:hypothetical protein